MDYYEILFAVQNGNEGEEEHLTVGNCGVGRTSLSPGIHDARWGTMMIAPYEYVWRGHHGILRQWGLSEALLRGLSGGPLLGLGVLQGSKGGGRKSAQAAKNLVFRRGR